MHVFLDNAKWIMITGYNTDVRYGDIVLHVQTEDKGEGNPFIESLIYYGGQVVVAKRTSYADKLDSGHTGEEVSSLMEHQHRAMMKAIQTGKFDEKIRLFVPDKGKKLQSSVSMETSGGFDLADDSGRTLDQVILEYLTNEAEQEQLVLSMDDIDLVAGASAHITLRAISSKSGDPVTASKIQVKMISTFGGPRSLAAGETDVQGLLQVQVDIPSVEKGTAALIISAASSIGQAELKHLL
jgi:hypothetical protein